MDLWIERIPLRSDGEFPAYRLCVPEHEVDAVELLGRPSALVRLVVNRHLAAENELPLAFMPVWDSDTDPLKTFVDPADQFVCVVGRVVEARAWLPPAMREGMKGGPCERTGPRLKPSG